METEKLTFVVEHKLVDSEGALITEGSVLQHPEGDRGVVVKVMRKDVKSTIPMTCTGDIHIATTQSTTRITNLYHEWTHIRREKQTYRERYLSWRVRPFEWDDFCDPGDSKEEGCAIDGIMSLLPMDPVDWEFGPWPDHIEDALSFLVGHLEELAGE